MSIAVEPEKLVLGPEHNGIRMTPEEFDAIEEYDELFRYELIDGVLVVNPFELPAGRRPNDELGHWLLTYREHEPRGSALDDTLFEEYIRTPTSRRRADRVIWVGLGRCPNPKTDVPNIVVEFVSAGRRNWKRDYLEKRDEYIAIGVDEYWVIDRFQRTLTVYHRTKEGGSTEHVVHEQDAYRPPLLPGFELPLGRLLSIADRWADAEQAE